MESKNGSKPMPYVSLCSALAFAVSVIVLLILEITHTPASPVAAQKARILKVMICVLFACWSSIVSLITAWCPIILAGDRRPLFWVIPLVLGWILFVQLFDWASLVPRSP